MPWATTHHRSSLVVRWVVLVLAMVLGGASVAVADRDRERERGRDRDPEILAVTTDTVERELIILGKHFGTKIQDVNVSLATFGPLTVKALMDTTTIIAQFPSIPVSSLVEGEEALPPGDYVLTVEIDGDEVAYGLTIGAVGPQGPIGPMGPDGKMGDRGMAGMNGQPGSSCAIDGTTLSCPDGTSLDLGGLSGDSGIPAQPKVNKRSQDGAINSEDEKTTVVQCHLDEVVVGGGYNLNSQGNALGSIIVTNNQPSKETIVLEGEVDTWQVTAVEHTPTEDGWGITAFALCMVKHVHILE